MRKILLFIATIFLVSGCDPVSNMEATIENLTAQTIIIEFVSPDEGLSKILQINPDETVRFQEGFDVGGTFLEPSLIEYDSVLIKNQTEQILKVYKENTVGKNIYNIDDHWISSEPSKRFYRYEYKVNNEDIE